MSRPNSSHAHNHWVELLQRVIHPEHKASEPLTCVATALSMNRRCWRQLAHEDHDNIHKLLERLPQVSGHPLERRQLLSQVADLSICNKAHKKQKRQIVNRWCDAVAAEEQNLLPDPSEEISLAGTTRTSSNMKVIIIFMLAVALICVLAAALIYMLGSSHILHGGL